MERNTVVFTLSSSSLPSSSWRSGSSVSVVAAWHAKPDLLLLPGLNIRE